MRQVDRAEVGGAVALAEGRRSAGGRWLVPTLAVAAFAAVAYYMIFRLPFHFPPQLRIRSASYVFGFNNTLAIVDTGALLLVATAWRVLWKRHDGTMFPNPLSLVPPKVSARARRIPWAVLALMAGVYLLFTLVLYRQGMKSPFYRFDFEASHFLWRLKLMDFYGMRPYTDFQFEYGPALIYPAAYQHRLLRLWSISHEASYYACCYLFNLLGPYCILAVCNRAAMPRWAKGVAFILVAVAAFPPYMGLNGVTARYLGPFVGLLLAGRAMVWAEEAEAEGAEAAAPRWLRRVGAFAVVLAVAAANILLSPEMGLAFSATWLAYSLYAYAYATPSNGPALTVALAALALAVVLGRIALPTAYFQSMFRFSAGANNLPLLPAAHLIFYLVTLFLAVPALLGAAIRSRRAAADAAPLFALGVLCVVLMPGALGRCDPPHVIYYGLGAYLIVLILAAGASVRQFAVYATVFAVVAIGGLQLSNAMAFYESEVHAITARYSPQALVRHLRHEGAPPASGPNAGAAMNAVVEPKRAVLTPAPLQALDKYPPLYLPFANYGTDKATEAYLWAHRKVAPGYFIGAIGVYTEDEVAAKLAEVSRHRYLLVLKGWESPWQRDDCMEQLWRIRHTFLYRVSLPCRSNGLYPDLAVNRYITASYHPVENVGGYVVLERNTTPPAS